MAKLPEAPPCRCGKPGTRLAMHHHHEFLSAMAAFVAGGGLVRAAAYVSQALPPLPANAGWWANFAYNLLKHATGVDPNSR